MTFRYRSRTNGQHLETAKEFVTTVIQCYVWVYQPAMCCISVKSVKFFFVIQRQSDIHLISKTVEATFAKSWRLRYVNCCNFYKP